MQIISLLLTCAAVAFAAPKGADPGRALAVRTEKLDIMDKRTMGDGATGVGSIYNPPTKTAHCGTQLWSSQIQTLAIQEGTKWISPWAGAKPTWGSATYPRPFNNAELLPMNGQCKGLTMYEYPIKSPAYTVPGGDPGPDRVVFSKDAYGGDEVWFCGVISHTLSLTPNGYGKCSEI